MTPTLPGQDDDAGPTLDNIIYVRQMLGELRNIADGEGAELLRYLIEMAYVEAGDIVMGQHGRNRDGFKPVRSTSASF